MTEEAFYTEQASLSCKSFTNKNIKVDSEAFEWQSMDYSKATITGMKKTAEFMYFKRLS
jgi:hypothetical protein